MKTKSLILNAHNRSKCILVLAFVTLLLATTSVRAQWTCPYSVPGDGSTVDCIAIPVGTGTNMVMVLKCFYTKASQNVFCYANPGLATYCKVDTNYVSVTITDWTGNCAYITLPNGGTAKSFTMNVAVRARTADSPTLSTESCTIPPLNTNSYSMWPAQKSVRLFQASAVPINRPLTVAKAEGQPDRLLQSAVVPVPRRRVALDSAD